MTAPSPPPRRPRRVLRALVALLAVCAVFITGVMVGGHPRTSGLNDLPPPLRDRLLGPTGDPVAVEVMQLLEDGYYVDVNPQKLARGSVDGVLKALDDPYSYYLDPEQYAQLQKHLDRTLEGIGVSVSRRSGGVVIVDVYEGGPAAGSGLKPGDRIISVDGVAAAGPKLDSIVARIRGKAGTQVKVGIRRQGAADRVYTITRAKVRVPVVRSRVVRRGNVRVGYLRLSEFDRGAGDEVREAVRRLDRDKVVGIVFDLRGDPGGLLDEAVSVTSAFVPDGSTVVTTEGRHRPKQSLTTDDDPVTRLPVVVLVDRNSASASEIVAGALRDTIQAPLVGERTFGKALVQTTRPLRNGGALRFTTARYLTPSGFDLAKRGLTPSVKVADKPDTTVDEVQQRGVAMAAARP